MIKLELTLTETLTILQALAFAGHYSKKQRGDEFSICTIRSMRS